MLTQNFRGALNKKLTAPDRKRVFPLPQCGHASSELSSILPQARHLIR